MLLEQTCELQSPSWRHDFPSEHAEHGPPQSTSVSELFFTPSEQEGDWQDPLVQTCDTQSFAAEQTLPVTQAEQFPPQSTSLSFPFFVPSEQLGVTFCPFGGSLEQETAPRDRLIRVKAIA